MVLSLLTFVLLLFVALCWVHGFTMATRPGMVLGVVSRLHIKASRANINRVKAFRHTRRANLILNQAKALRYISKPFYACIYCMASVHGSIVYFAFSPEWPVYWLIVFIVALCGLIHFSLAYD